MPSDDQEKTEQATPKRREEAQKKGQVVTSRELSSAVVIFVGAAALNWFGPQVVSGLKANMIRFYGTLSSAPMNDVIFTTIMRDGMWTLLTLMVPIVGLVTLAGVISPVLQHGFVWTMTPMMPDWSRVDPISGFGKILSVQGLVNGLKTLLKFLVVGGVAYLIIQQEMEAVLSSGRASSGEVLGMTGAMVMRLILWTGFVIGVMGAADYGFQRWEHERKLKMSHQEVKQEQKETDGNPQIKSRIKTLQREASRKRMMADVPKADVIITNPTHLAVAMQYSPGMMAPKVLAKGSGFVASKIREIARQHSIPIVENKPLARTIFKTVKVGEAIPSNIYRAVAEILAYVFKLRGERN